jgi:hypothetical protein
MWRGLLTRYCQMCHGVEADSDVFTYFIEPDNEDYPVRQVKELFGNG